MRGWGRTSDQTQHSRPQCCKAQSHRAKEDHEGDQRPCVRAEAPEEEADEGGYDAVADDDGVDGVAVREVSDEGVSGDRCR